MGHMTNWPPHLKDLGLLLEEKRNDKDLAPYMDNVREVAVEEFMCTRAGMWIACGMQGPWSVYSGRITTPQKLHDDFTFKSGIRHLGRLDIYSDGSCYFIVQDYVDHKAEVKPASHHGWYPRFFMWQVCDHETTSKKLGNCYYEYTCKKCGYTHRVDSSG